MFTVLFNEHRGELLHMNHSPVYLDRQHHYSSVFLRDHHLNIPDHMFVFLFDHQAHKIHCSQTSRSRLKKLNDVLVVTSTFRE